MCGFDVVQPLYLCVSQEWDALCEGWMGKAFNDIDAEAIGVQVTQYLKVAVRAERGLPGNLVAPKLKSMVEEFKQLLPAEILGELGAK